MTDAAKGRLMKAFVKKYPQLPVAAGLAAVLALCAWTFGWFGGTVDVMDFAADEVERVELFHYWLGDRRVAVTEPEDIRALLEAVNDFQNTGTMLRYPQKLFAGGGELWYEITVYLSDGERVSLTLTHLDSRLTVSDMEMQYGRFHTCRGSMELFYALHEKYSAENAG